jgi:hypothetical protein
MAKMHEEDEGMSGSINWKLHGVKSFRAVSSIPYDADARHEPRRRD